MAKFTVHSINSETKKFHQFLYDNEKSYIFDMTEGIQYPTDGLVKKSETNPNNYNNISFPLQKSNPIGKTKNFKTLKISFGLKCNYSCTYCSQRFVPDKEDEEKFDVDNFTNKIFDTFNFGKDGEGKTVEFWGGEPLLYWKKLIPISKKIKEKFEKIKFILITNGSLITKEKVDILYDLGFSVAVSHDGPGQHVRGPDPFSIEKTKDAIMYMHDKMGPEGRFSLNAMLNCKNKSRRKIKEYFVNLTGNDHIQIGEGGFIDAYDIGGIGMSLAKDEFHDYSLQSFSEIRQGHSINFISVREKIKSFLKTFYSGKNSKTISQKCGMDKEYNIVVDLNGDVLTCQNVSSVSTAPNGESHKIGNIDDFDNIKLTTSTHWSHREKCSSCPVLHLCQGSCMFLEGPLWEASCNNAYYDNIPYFCSVIEHMTGCVPIYIDGDLPEERKDIFGLFEDGKFSEENFDSKKFYEFLETR
jgi:uncharacterized protein